MPYDWKGFSCGTVSVRVKMRSGADSGIFSGVQTLFKKKSGGAWVPTPSGVVSAEVKGVPLSLQK